jgi:AbrB family looped-hinge helix DNA binding protein
MPKATITSKGQLTLPKEIRARLGVAAGDQVDFTIDSDGSINVAAAKRSAARLYGMLRTASTGGTTVEDMNREIAARTAAEDERIRDQQS